MSDGPYKTLKMSPKWRILAKLAGNSSHDLEEVAQAVPVALASDWRQIQPSFLRQLRAVLGGDDEGQLLPEIARQEVQRLRTRASNSMEALLADNAQDVLRDGHRRADTFEEAVAATLAERADRGLRQVEEHYRREASSKHGSHIRGRLTASVAANDLRALALGLASGVSARQLVDLTDRSGLDVGVSL